MIEYSWSSVASMLLLSLVSKSSMESFSDSSIMAIGSLTFTSTEPSAISIFPKMPSSADSNSITALSVSISAITSPDDI